MSDIVERLAPCPFCGGEAELDNAAEPQFARRPTVTCKNENCFGYMPSAYYARDAEAIAAWNRRSDATITALREEVERLSKSELDAYNAGASQCADALTALRQRVVAVGKPLLAVATAEGKHDHLFRAARALVNEMETTK